MPSASPSLSFKQQPPTRVGHSSTDVVSLDPSPDLLSRHPSRFAGAFGLLVPVLLLGLLGCEKPTSSARAAHHHPAHQPHDFVAAAARLTVLNAEIQDRILAPRPADPYRDADDGHGHAHDHDHPHDHGHDHDHDHDHDHEHEHEHGHGHGHGHHHHEEVVELDAWEEMLDVVKWLPLLAADTDLDEANWNRVATAAQQLREALQPHAGQPAAARQAAYRDRIEELSTWIETIQEVSEAYVAEQATRTY